MDSLHLLLVEDDPGLAESTGRALRSQGWEVDVTARGEPVALSLKQDPYDLVILDIGLAGIDGFETLRRIRREGLETPVLILTARDSLMERVHTLKAGADDFLAKPFELAELEARLLALVRRARGSEHPRFACGALVYDPVGQQLLLRHQPLKLTPREHALLRALVQHSGEPLSKRDLMERVFADEADVQPEAVEVLVHRLRKRLEGSGVRISTLRGLGYVLEPDSATPGTP